MTDNERKQKLVQFRKEIEDLENVVGVAWDPEQKEYVALVTEKMPESELADDQIVAKKTTLSDDEHGVEEVGHLEAHPLTVDTSDRLRPVPAGAEEHPDDSNWVGTGSFIAEVTDTSKGEWASDVSEGTVVRISNWHVYVNGSFEPLRPIRQPFRGDEVGELVGSVPLEDGVTVDAAARTVSTHDGWGAYELDTAEDGSAYGSSVVSDLSDDHAGQTVTKSGRTTDVTTAEIRQLDASVRVNYGTREDPNLVRIEDCVITSDLGDRGDSGAPVYLTVDGALCGLYFAGSDTTGVFSQIGNVAASLGVDPITNWDSDTPPAEHNGDDLEAFKTDLIDYIENWGG